MRTRILTGIKWAVWSPRRFRAVIAAAVGAVAVLAAVAGWTVVRQIPKASSPPTATCETAAATFAEAFFDSPKDQVWTRRVAQYVTERARPSVFGITPTDTPAGPATITSTTPDGKTCTARVAIPGMALEIDLTRSGGAWLVDSWGPR